MERLMAVERPTLSLPMTPSDSRIIVLSFAIVLEYFGAGEFARLLSACMVGTLVFLLVFVLA